MAFMPPGGANGPASIQQLAQNAAQNVLRRQRMKALLQAGASSAAGEGSAMGGARPVHGSFAPHTMQLNPGQFRLPYQTLAGLAAGARGSHAGFGTGGVIGGGGGGADFASLPNPHDHSQSPSSVIGPQPTQPAPAPATPGGQGQILHVGESTNPVGGSSPYDGQGPVLPGAVNSSPGVPTGVNWIPLGGGLFYDPENDLVRGGSSAVAPNGGLNPVDKRF